MIWVIAVWSSVTVWIQTDLFPRMQGQTKVTPLQQMIDVSTQTIIISPFFLSVDGVEEAAEDIECRFAVRRIGSMVELL
jgi:hypothetical protein